jgi:hypothetical protein
MPETHPDRKKAWDKAMKEDPDWKAFVKKKRAVEKPERLESKEPPHALSAFPGGELGFFTMYTERQPASAQRRQPASSPNRQPASLPKRQPANPPNRQPASLLKQQLASAPKRQPASLPKQQPASAPNRQPASLPKRQPASAPKRSTPEQQLASSLIREQVMIDHDHSVINHDHSVINHDHSTIDHDDSMFHHTRYDPIRDKWLIDTGTQVHICNNRSLFIEFQEAESSIRVGDTETTIGGIGTVLIHGVSPRENETPKQMTLFNVRYSPGFHTNIISHGLMFSNTKAFLNFEKNWIQQDGIPLYAIYQDQNLPWLKQPGSIPPADTDLQDAEMQDAEIQDPDLTDIDLQGSGGREREMQREEIGQQQTIAMLKPSDHIPIAPALIRPRQASIKNLHYTPASPHQPASPTIPNLPFSPERTPFSSSPAPDTPVSASQTPRSLHTDAADADAEHASNDKVRDNGTHSETASEGKLRACLSGSEAEVRDNSLPMPAPGECKDETETPLQQELAQTPDFDPEPPYIQRSDHPHTQRQRSDELQAMIHADRAGEVEFAALEAPT